MRPDQQSDPSWTDGQRQFLSALEKAGANKPEYALPIDRVLPLPVRELQALVDSGIVREASSNGYYLYPNQIRALAPVSPESGIHYRSSIHFRSNQALTPGRIVKVLLFWLIII